MDEMGHACIPLIYSVKTGESLKITFNSYENKLKVKKNGPHNHSSK